MKFNETLEAVNVAVMSMYPEARFYEAQGILDEVDGKIVTTVSQMTIVYFLPMSKSLMVNVDSDKNMEFKVVDVPWLEDRFMTPYVPATLEEAIARMESANYVLSSNHVVLRHPLSPNYTRPVYIIGDTKVGGYKVDCYTAEVGIID